MKISLDKKTLKNDAKTAIKKNLIAIKNRLFSNSNMTAKALFNAYLQSLMIYYLLPLFASDIITLKEIDDLETGFKR